MEEEDRLQFSGGPTTSLTAALRAGRTLAEFRAGLPIARHRRALLWAVERHQVTVLVGGSGCGKTSQLPQYLHEIGWTAAGKMIACTQTRPSTAVSAAERVAEELGCPPGSSTVTPALLFDDRSVPGRTCIKYMADGLLFRELLFDPLLNSYSVIILDDAHERALYTEVLLALLKRVLLQRTDLRLVVVSATFDAGQRFADYFKVRQRTPGTVSGPARPQPAEASDEHSLENPSREPVLVCIDGPGQPLTVTHVKEPCSDFVRAAVDTVLQIDRAEGPGDMLVFLPGKADIDRALDLFTNAHGTRHLYPLALHGALPPHQQQAVFQTAPPAYRRRVVFATNLAETSLTLPGIRFVVDTGVAKRRVYDPCRGTSRMLLAWAGRSAARQRAGRAASGGGPGKAFRLYTRGQLEAMPQHAPGELQNADLTALVLRLKALSIHDPAAFGFLDPPPAGSLRAARDALHALGALDDAGALTPAIGVPMAELPVDPPLARMLLAAASLRCTANVLSIVTMLAVGGDTFLPSADAEMRRKMAVEEGDLLGLHNIYLAYHDNRANAAKWAPRHGLVLRKLQKAERLRSSLAAQLRHLGVDPTLETNDAIPVLKAIFAGLFMNLARCCPDGSYRLVRDMDDSPQALFMHPDSALFKRIPDWVVFTDALHTTKLFMQNVSIVDKAWITEIAPHYFNLKYR